ncbi:MAG TPA: low-specificity L-threonine aldolase [Fimbriiglobus sp.]|nr:low-specificity L-threonine aldolase [Fimbriiglobus sp.]
MIDLRSDTVTKPTPAMRAAMFAAEVGDDVYGEDPTVNQLEERVADTLAKEAALFVPSGTMANQVAVRLHCRPGDELLCEATSHVYLWEGGAPAALSGVTTRLIPGAFGVLSVRDLEGTLHPPDDIHSPTSRLVCLENTHNRGGGRVYPVETVREVSAWARRNGLGLHLDGARLWNAVVASGVAAREWCGHFDTVAVCFSKGLGAPVGSALAGTRDMIRQARRVRKLYGGAMRQAGFLAAACLYAMDHHIDRLVEDHANAKLLAAAVADTPGLKLVPPAVETNLVWFEVAPEVGTARQVAGRLKDHGILVAALGETVVRACTHLDVSRADCERAAEVIRRHAAAG